MSYIPHSAKPGAGSLGASNPVGVSVFSSASSAARKTSVLMMRSVASCRYSSSARDISRYSGDSVWLIKELDARTRMLE